MEHFNETCHTLRRQNAGLQRGPRPGDLVQVHFGAHQMIINGYESHGPSSMFTNLVHIEKPRHYVYRSLQCRQRGFALCAKQEGANYLAKQMRVTLCMLNIISHGVHVARDDIFRSFPWRVSHHHFEVVLLLVIMRFLFLLLLRRRRR